MNFCIDADELRKALAEIEVAERHGFLYCLAVFRISSAGHMISECRASYSDLLERAHPSDGRFDWGRCQSVTRDNLFTNGHLIPIRKNKKKGKK